VKKRHTAGRRPRRAPRGRNPRHAHDGVPAVGRRAWPPGAQVGEAARALLERNGARARLREDTDCVRLCAGAADGLPGVIVDRFGPLVVGSLFGATDAAAGTTLFTLLRDLFPGDSVIVKGRTQGEGERAAWAPLVHLAAERPQPIVAHELGIAFEIGTDPARDFGLFLDAAKARAHARAHARGRRVLNLFAYAGGFGLAAAKGGAADVANVDPDRDHLAWARRNAERNRVAMRILPDTAQVFLARHARRRERALETPAFDFVIADPPAFGVGRGPARILRRFWPDLFAHIREMAPAHVLLLCNDKAFRARTDFAALVEAELGHDFAFARLGTYLRPADLTAPAPDLAYHPTPEDPAYQEPIVLAGRRRA